MALVCQLARWASIIHEHPSVVQQFWNKTEYQKHIYRINMVYFSIHFVYFLIQNRLRRNFLLELTGGVHYGKCPYVTKKVYFLFQKNILHKLTIVGDFSHSEREHFYSTLILMNYQNNEISTDAFSETYHRSE